MYEKVLFISCAMIMVLGASVITAVLDGGREGPEAAQGITEPSYYRVGHSSYEMAISSNDGAGYELLLPLPQRMTNVSAFAQSSAVSKVGEIPQLSVQSTEYGFALAVKGSGNATLRFASDDFEGTLTLYDETGRNWMFCSTPEVRLRLTYAHTTMTYMDDGGEYDRQWVSLDTYCYEFQGLLSCGWGIYDIPNDMTED
jgi:hypothetical protein